MILLNIGKLFLHEQQRPCIRWNEKKLQFTYGTVSVRVSTLRCLKSTPIWLKFQISVMSSHVKKKLIIAAVASSGILGILGYPAIKNVYPIKKKATVTEDYLDLPTATADLTKDVPEGVGASADISVNVSHWLLLSHLKSDKDARSEAALEELARRRRWSDAECLEIAQALDRQDIIKLARTVDADLRLFLPPPTKEFIEKTLDSEKIEKFVKSILRDVSENSDCSSCTNFYTNLSIRIRPDSNILAMNELNQIDKMMHSESRKRKRTIYNDDVIRLKAVLNNVICGEKQAITMVQSGMLIALLYFRHKYPKDTQINGLLSQILANLSVNATTRDYIFINGWIQTLLEYSRNEHLEISMPAFKALANLDQDAVKQYGLYGNHIYLLSPLYRGQPKTSFDVIFVHGLVGSVFKSWRQGSIPLDEFGRQQEATDPPTTELLPSEFDDVKSTNNGHKSRCWPKDWLAEDVPELRILAVDYPSALSNWRTDCDLSKDTLKERATHVLNQLKAANVGTRPIIWVTHSMGGLLVKQMLVICDEQLRNNSSNNNNSDSSQTIDKFKQDILQQSKGIVFYSVPHRGSNLSWIERKNLQKLLLLTTEVIELQKGSPVLMDLHDRFLNLSNRNIEYLSYAEESVSSFGVNKVVQWKGVLVHEDSLQFEKGPNIKLKIDHAHTCKPHSKESITYRKTLEFIKALVPHKEAEKKDEQLMPYISFIF